MPAEVAMARNIALLASLTAASEAAVQRSPSFLQLARAKETPISRVVGLLKEMQGTIDGEMNEDEELYKKLKCWCNDNGDDKKNAAENSEAKISQLEASIEELSSRSAELRQSVDQLNTQVSANKQALKEATALREKQVQDAHSADLDRTQAIENIKAALTVLDAAASSFVQLDIALPTVGSKSEDDADVDGAAADASSSGPDASPVADATDDDDQAPLSFLAVRRKDAWTDSYEMSHVDHALDEYMRRDGIDDSQDDSSPQGGFLQQAVDATTAAPVVVASRASGGLSGSKRAVIQKALQSATAFLQGRDKALASVPEYEAQSGQIVGILKQMKETMEKDQVESQKLEQERSKTFEDLRSAKSEEIKTGESMSEKKEDQLATTDNELAEAKEDLGQEKTALQEAKEFSANLETTCGEADKNFEERKRLRTDELKAVSDTIGILEEDEARNLFSDTFTFLQTSASSKLKRSRSQASRVLRRAGAKARDPRLSLLATSAQLDSFTKVKKAIDDMVAAMQVQQEDETKKNDWCKASLQDNEMTTLETESLKGDLEAKEATLANDIATAQAGVDTAEEERVKTETALQQANKDRKQENLDFQKTVKDQMLTIAVLKKAFKKLSDFYDNQAFLQQQRQTPPVPQAEYKPSAGAGGIMQMMEKLMQDCKDMISDAKKAEAEAQAAYEQNVADSQVFLDTLHKEIVTKTRSRIKNEHRHQQTKQDILDTVKELEGLGQEKAGLHTECDYLLKNFEVRQQARSEEIAAMQQAKQILSGALS